MEPTASTETAPPRQRADARRNREKVLRAAKDQFAAHGLDAQMDEIAREAGVGVGTVYRHFPNKADLVQALADQRFAGLAAAAERALAAEDAWQGFEEFMTYCAREMSEDRSLSEAMDQLPGICATAAQKTELGPLTERLVSRAQASGQLRGDVTGADVPALVCGIGRAVAVEYEGTPTMDWQRYLEFILAGLRARGE